MRSHSPASGTRTSPPDPLRKKIGAHVALDSIFTPEKIRACQAMVDAAYANLFKEMLESVASVEKEYAEVMADPAHAEPYIEHISQLTFSIKKKMENLGLAFGSEIVKSLHDYVCSLPDYNVENANISLIVSKHIEVLRARFQEGRQTDSDMEKNIMASLELLVRKAVSKNS